MKNIVANFNYNNREYVYLLEGNKIVCGYKTNLGIDKNLTKDEKEMIKYVLSKIIISNDKNNHYKCGNFIHNGKRFQIMYDEISKRKFFYQIIDNNYALPSVEDNLYLFKMFNSSILYIKDNNNNPSNSKNHKNNKIEFIVDYCMKGLRVTASILILGICLEYCGGHNYITKLVSKFVPYSIESMVENIKENKNLTEQEKKNVISCFNIIEDNQEYINTFMIENRLKYLNINYNKKTESMILGRYNPLDDLITIYCAESFDEVCDNELYMYIISHKISHIFGSDSNTFLGKSFAEAVNDQFTREYIQNYDEESYYEERMCLYSLCEIINPNDFKELHFKGGCKSIIDDLTDIINDKKMAYELIGNVDSLRHYNKEFYNCKNDEDRDDIYAQYVNTKNEIYNSISKYFYAKYGYNIEYDEIMMLYLVNSGFCSSIDTPFKINDVTRIISKGYFSSDYKVSNPETIYYKKIIEPNEDHYIQQVTVKNINREMRKEYLEKNGLINNNQSNENDEIKRKY